MAKRSAPSSVSSCSVCGRAILQDDPVVIFSSISNLPPVHVRCWQLSPPPQAASFVFSETPMPPLDTIGAQPGGRPRPGPSGAQSTQPSSARKKLSPGR
jgi:hypothetical protein